MIRATWLEIYSSPQLLINQCRFVCWSLIQILKNDMIGLICNDYDYVMTIKLAEITVNNDRIDL